MIRDNSQGLVHLIDNNSKLGSSGEQPNVEDKEALVRLKKFQRILEKDEVDLDALRKLAWNGVPSTIRATVWKYLLGYTPTQKSQREAHITRKRQEYRGMLSNFYSNGSFDHWLSTASSQEKKVYHQIEIDIPRTLPFHVLFQQPQISTMLERILLVWAIRHPASFYVQGINDLVCPFIIVFLIEAINFPSNYDVYKAPPPTPSELHQEEIDAVIQMQKEMYRENERLIRKLYIENGESYETEEDDEEMNLYRKTIKPTEDFTRNLIVATALDEATFDDLEADLYWCLTKFLDSIQDYYTQSQPGIFKGLKKLEQLIEQLDKELNTSISSTGAQFVQFGFRWFNCMLMREIPLTLSIRLWDTYISEGDRFPVLHVYVCASLIMSFASELKGKDFQKLMIFLQNLPTSDWTAVHLAPILSHAFILSNLYEYSPKHLVVKP